MKEVKIYSTPSCPYCKMAKDYLNSKGITYRDIDVSGNQDAAQEMVLLSGQMGVPVLVINGEVVLGFDRTKIDSLIGQ